MIIGRTILCFLAAVGCASASNLDRLTWSDGPIEILVDVSGASGADSQTLLQAVSDAAARWNRALRLPLFQLRASSVTAPVLGDRVNMLYFSQTISPGVSFGSQFGYAAMTNSGTGLLVEGDLIFNPAHEWFYYHGPLRHEANGDRIPDLHRVALHEMGHLLGLYHPGTDTLSTIMNGRMSNVDGLTEMDLKDARRITARLLERNAPKIRRPRAGRASSSSTTYRLRGKGTPFFVRTLFVRGESVSGSWQRRVRVRKHWTAQVSLQPGENRLSFYYPTSSGRRELFARRLVVVP